MNQDAEKPTIKGFLMGDFFDEEDVTAIRERLEPQFQVDLDEDDILWPAFVELPTIYIYAGIDIILSPPVRDILLNLASSALYDALMYMGSRAQRAELATKTETKFRISLKDENERPIYEVDGSTSDPEVVKQLLQQVSDVARQALDD